MAETFYRIYVLQTDALPSEFDRPEEIDDLVVLVNFCKTCVSLRSPTFDDPDDIIFPEVVSPETEDPVDEIAIYLPFSVVKQTWYESYYREAMKPQLSEIDIPETLHEEIFDKLFPVIHKAETTEMPIVVCVFECFTATAESAVGALEQVRLDAAIKERQLPPSSDPLTLPPN